MKASWHLDLETFHFTNPWLTLTYKLNEEVQLVAVKNRRVPGAKYSLSICKGNNCIELGEIANSEEVRPLIEFLEKLDDVKECGCICGLCRCHVSSLLTK